MKKRLLAAAAVAAVLPMSAANAGVVINEVDYDQVGSDTAEFIELFNNGTTNEAIGNYVIALINGANNTFYTPITTIPAGTTLAPGAYYVVGNVAGANQAFPGAQDQVQNGSPDAVGLYSSLGGIASGAASTTNSGALVDGVVYEGPAPAASYPGYTQYDTTLSDSSTTNISFGRSPNGTGPFALLASPTPGAANAAAVPEPTAVGVAAVGLLGLIARRRRRSA